MTTHKIRECIGQQMYDHLLSLTEVQALKQIEDLMERLKFSSENQNALFCELLLLCRQCGINDSEAYVFIAEINTKS